MDKVINRLQEYIDTDLIYQDYKKGNTQEFSDFEVFCINHCKDIETVLKELEDNQTDLTTVYIKGVCDEKSKWRDKIREKIEELKQAEILPLKKGEIDLYYFAEDILQELLEGE